MIETYELAVIGAGPAGMQAAISASKNGVKTILIDSYPQPGGQYFMQLPVSYKADNVTETEQEGISFVARVNSLPITRLQNTLTWGIFREETDQDWLVALYGANSPKYIRTQNLIIANGAYDTPVAFPGWTLPGVITCGAALILLKSQRLAPGTRALVTGTGPLLLSVSAHLIAAGVDVAAVCESNPILPHGIKYAPTMLSHWHRLKEGAKYLRTILQGKATYKTGWSIQEACGKYHVEEAVITKLDKKGKPIAGTQKSFPVDLVITGYSLTPNTGLARMIGCELDYQSEKGGWVPVRNNKMESSIPGIYIVGDGAGIGGAENSQLEGQIAATAVSVSTGHLDFKIAKNNYAQLKHKLSKQQQFGVLYGGLFSPQQGLINLATDQTILCRCEEVTLGEIKSAVSMGARTIGEVKMITRTGMGNCQGRMCEHSVSAAIVEALAAELATQKMVGHYSIRPPLHPLPQNFLAEAQLETE
jgi:NADPH-dependent 2,4-dienoyl-CoA reductase/sulfur reductase-like enzyme